MDANKVRNQTSRRAPKGRPATVQEHNTTRLCFVTTCMGRLFQLKQTIGRIAEQADSSCVVVDYSCPDGCGDWVAANHPNVTVVRVEDARDFNASRARNLGVRAANSPWLCFLDADILLAPDFADQLFSSLQPGRFYRGPDALGTCGTFVCSREDFERAGGYDEVIRGYGGEDRDLYDLLEFVGATPDTLATPVEHLEHSHSLRAQHHAEKNVLVSALRNRVYRAMKLDLMRVLGEALTLSARQRLYERVSLMVHESPREHARSFRLALPMRQRDMMPVSAQEACVLESKLSYELKYVRINEPGSAKFSNGASPKRGRS